MFPPLVICPAGLRRGETSALKRPAVRPCSMRGGPLLNGRANATGALTEMTSNTAKFRSATRLVHGGVQRSQYGETSEAIFLTSGFVYDNAEQAEATFTGAVQHYQYSRFGNPTVAMLEQRLAEIEGADVCCATATGMAAVNAALLSHLKSGDRVVASRALFGSCHWIVSTLLPRYGIATEFVDGGDLDQWRAALSRPANLVLLETPSNPMLEMVDNVFATPLLQQPLTFGADVVVYSCTKHIDGQGRVLGGAVLGAEKWMNEVLRPFVRNTGPTLSAFNAWLLLKGMETLALRVDAASRAAAAIADFLAIQPGVSRVWYPTRADHPQHDLVVAQMSAGGTLVTFEVAGGKAGAFAVMNGFGLIAISNNLGDSKSLATHPATTTHMRIGEDERARLGLTDGGIRLSVGREEVGDLKEDRAGALAKLRA